jgi:hypothetical protein
MQRASARVRLLCSLCLALATAAGTATAIAGRGSTPASGDVDLDTVPAARPNAAAGRCRAQCRRDYHAGYAACAGLAERAACQAAAHAEVRRCMTGCETCQDR